jgi:hypothetical protein
VTVLSYLSQGLLQENNFRDALHYYTLLEKIQLAGEGVQPFVAFGKSRCYLGLQMPYEAFSACVPFADNEQCLLTLNWIEKHLGLFVADTFSLRYKYEAEGTFDWMKAMSLFVEDSRNSYLLDLYGDFLFDRHQLEIAYDVWLIGSLLHKERQDDYTVMARNYRQKLDGTTVFDQAAAFYFYYYLKYDQESALRYRRYSLVELRDFFMNLVTYSGSDGYENYYRLAYLHYLSDDTSSAMKAISQAIVKSPDRFYQTLFQLLAEQVFGRERPKAVEIGNDDLMKVPGAREIFNKQ